MAVEEGKKAPAFRLPSSAGGMVSLRDFKDTKNVVLYFYPRDNTPGCTREACAFRDAVENYRRRDAVVLGVSTDSLDSHGKFIDTHKLNFPLLADTDHAVAEKYGVWREKKNYGKTYMGIVRSTFVIDKNGTLRKIFSKVKVEGHAGEVLEALDQINRSR